MGTSECFKLNPLNCMCTTAALFVLIATICIITGFQLVRHETFSPVICRQMSDHKMHPGGAGISVGPRFRRNEKPIIGVFAQESRPFFKKYGHTYLPSIYVKYLEGAGARVVPIRVNEDDAYYHRLFKRINGIFLPGGAVYVFTSPYGRAAKIMYDLAVKANDAGDYFPIWGSCLGFEMLAAFATGQQLVTKCLCRDLHVPLQITPDCLKTRLFKNMPARVFRILTTLNVTANNHQYCLTPKTFSKSKQLSSFYKAVTTNKDSLGNVFISTIEAIEYPFYATAWHPEKNGYEWTTALNIDHSAEAIYAMQYFADFFVNEARKSNHKFPSKKEEADALIDNYQSIYFKEPYYHGYYFFNLTSSEFIRSSYLS